MKSKTRKQANTRRKKSTRRQPRGKRPEPRNIFGKISTSSYFSFPAKEKRLLRQAQDFLGLKIDGWSFTPHPLLLEAVSDEGSRLVRYIFTIDTLRAGIYEAVLSFIQKSTTNVNSYFTGGSADFICDIHASDDYYKSLYDDLVDILKKAGAGRFEDVKSLIAVYRVDKAVMMCGKLLADLGTPSPDVVSLVKQDVAKFELAYRNYMAEDTRAAFGGDRKVREYLERLERGRAIVGYHGRIDHCGRVDREYVPLCNGRPLDKLIQEGGAAERRAPLLKPVVELLSVSPIKPTDAAEREVTHVLINEYDSPGERNVWRRRLYSELGHDVNLFTFPLEGTISQSAIVLSDLPEAIEESRLYAGPMRIGSLSHSAAPPEKFTVSMRPESLANQGVTLGRPGSGKTYTDCVLIEEAAKYIKKIIVIDDAATHGIRNKLSPSRDGTTELVKYLPIATDVSDARIAALIRDIPSGVVVVEAGPGMMPRVLDACLNEIESCGVNSGNEPRAVIGLLLVEEANDALGDGADREKRVRRLEALLNKAFRQGWCIWLSTQQLRHLGYDKESALRVARLLRNRIIHIPEQSDVDLIRNMLSDVPPHQLRNKVDLLVNCKRGLALMQWTDMTESANRTLPPVMTSVRKLGELPAPITREDSSR